MKTTKGLVHAVFRCKDCDKEWQDYLTAQDRARAHASKHNHTVAGETGYSVTYDGKK
jgi:hypothetical protein